MKIKVANTTKVRKMNNTSRQIVLVILAVGVTIGAVIFLKGSQPKEAKTEVKKSFKAVRVKYAKLGTHKAEVKFSGKLTAEEKIDVYTEVGGVLMTENFKQGNSFTKGSPLAQLNSIEFSNNLKAAKSQLITQVTSMMGDLKMDYPESSNDWELFLNGIDVDKALMALPELKNEKLKRFVAGKGVLNSYYSLKGQEEKLSKFTLNAPFSGILTSALIKKGTLVRNGQKIGEFINPSSFELETEISLSDLQFIQKGSLVQLHSDDLNKSWNGKVTRINSSLDASSQMVTVFIRVSGSGLKEGMFLHGSAKGSSFDDVALVNRKLLKNGGLYLVEKGIVKHKKLEVLYVNQSKAIVKGLEKNDQFVADNMKGLYEGMLVKVAK